MAGIQRALSAVMGLLLSLSPTAGSTLAQGSDVNITVDATSTFQKIDGFGVNANARSWNNGQLAPALDMLVDQMGAQIFRVILEKSDWQPSPDTSDPSLYETRKFQNLWGTIGYLNSKHVTVMLNLMGTIPDWMGGSSLSSDQEDQWVNMVASMVNYGRNVRHVQINLLSPMNEEDIGAPEGPRVGPDQYVRVLDKLTARLEVMGLGNVHIVGPDAASAAAGASSYAPLMLADAALMPVVDHFSVHSYSGDTGPMGSTLGQSAYGDRDFWVTEWSAWCQGCDHGMPVGDEWSFAGSTADLLLNHLEHGASAALVYEGYDSYYEHHGAFSYWGQLAFDQSTGTYAPRKRFFTNAQVFRFVTPGMVRIGTAVSDGAVRALAFRDPVSGQLAIVGHNTRPTDTSLHIALQGMQADSSFHVYQTTASLDLAQGPDAIAQGGVLNVTVAGDGFFTLTTSGTGISLPLVQVAPAMQAAPTTALVGEAGLQSAVDSNDPGTAEAFQSVARGSGSANRLYVYVGGGSIASQVQVGLYADNNGNPGDLLAAGTITNPHGGAWNHVDVPPVDVSAGTRYWIAVLSPAGGGKLEMLDAGSSGGTSVTSSSTALGSLPSPWSSGASWSSSPLSAYAAQEP